MYSRETTTFVKAVELGSFNKAAKELYLSSVSVMKQVDSLEARVGAKLLERTNHGIKLTPAGKVIYDEAVRIIGSCDEAMRRARDIARGQRRPIRMGTSLLRPCDDVVDRWMRAGIGNHGFRIEIAPFSEERLSADRLVAMLEDEIDLYCGPCDSQSWREQCSVTELGTWRVRVGVPRSDPLARKGMLSWDDLSGKELLLPSSGESDALDRLRREIAREHPDVKVVDWKGFYDVSAFNECAERGCLMETLEAWEDVHPSIATLPMAWGYAVPYGIVTAKEPRDEVEWFVRIVANAR